MIKVKYKFIRSDSLNGILKTNRASADAIGALSQWEMKDDNRSYRIELDEPNQLIAVLSFGYNDSERSGMVLESHCERHGISCEYISETD